MTEAAALLPEHRSWRTKVFIAAWVSYVGFYFCRKPFSAAKAAIAAETHWNATTLGNIWAAYLVTYALGQFVAAGMGTRFGPRKNVLAGMAISDASVPRSASTIRSARASGASRTSARSRRPARPRPRACSAGSASGCAHAPARAECVLDA